VSVSSLNSPAGRAAILRIPRRLPGGAPLGFVAVCVLVAVLVALPIPVTIVQALQGGVAAAGAAIRATSPRVLLLHSVLVALIAAPLTGLIGVSCAWFVERTAVPGRRVWTMLLVAPITMPLFVTSYAWVPLGSVFEGLLGAAGIISFSYYPIVFLLVAASLRGMDPAAEESARSLGLGAWRTFFRVVLQQLRPALLGVCCWWCSTRWSSSTRSSR
jgi:iron(III) transport system permease protein